MGVEYVVQVAYGFVMEEPPAKFPDWEQWYEDSDDGVLDWIDKSGWDKLTAGKSPNADDFYYVVIESSSVNFVPRENPFTFKRLQTPTAHDVNQLVQAYNALDLGAGEIGWVVMLNVY